MLYDNGAFSLQYVSPAFELVGAYLLQDGRIGFAFSPSGSASGTLNGDVLEIRYKSECNIRILKTLFINVLSNEVNVPSRRVLIQRQS